MFQLAKKSSTAKATASSFGLPKKEKNKSSIKIVAKKSALRTKTLIDAMQTLNIIPSFSTSNFGGDILPENVLIKNILDGMVASVNNLVQIMECLENPDFVNIASLRNLRPFLVKLREATGTLKASIKKPMFTTGPPEDYDADTEGQDQETKNRGKLRKRGRSSGTSETEDSQEQDAEKFVIGASR